MRPTIKFDHQRKVLTDGLDQKGEVMSVGWRLCSSLPNLGNILFCYGVVIGIVRAKKIHLFQNRNILCAQASIHTKGAFR